MRSLLAISGSMLCVLVMTACAIDDEPASRDNPAATSADPSEIVEVPPELSFDALDEAATGDEYTGDGDKDDADTDTKKECKVRMESCFEGKPPHATYCFTGDCKGDEAYKKAKYLCGKHCKKGQCNKLTVKHCKKDW
jgi:hypothetical protein